MAGLSATGFSVKPLDDIVNDLGTGIAERLGQTVDIDPRSVFGQILAVVGGALDDLWELTQATYSASDPAKAQGQQLDAIASLTGTIRKGATKSTADLVAAGDIGTPISPVGQSVQNAAGDILFVTTSTPTLAAATAWAATTAYAKGDVVTNGGRIYVCHVAGTSGSTGPVGTVKFPVLETDGTVTWAFVGTGLGFALLTAESADAGAFAASAYTLNTIGTPIVGWKGIANPEDAVTGTNLETDAELRARRVDELHGLAKSTLESIRAAVLAITGVTAATVFENITDVVDVDGVPAHAVEVLVSGSAATQTIADAIFSVVAAGIETHGTISNTVTDSQGTDHTIRHSNPTETEIYVEANLSVHEDIYPADGDAQVAAAILAGGNALPVSYDVEPSAIVASIFSIPGVLAATVYVDTVPIVGTPSAPIVIGPRGIAEFDSARITVNSAVTVP